MRLFDQMTNVFLQPISIYHSSAKKVYSSPLAFSPIPSIPSLSLVHLYKVMLKLMSTL